MQSSLNKKKRKRLILKMGSIANPKSLIKSMNLIKNHCFNTPYHVGISSPH